MKNREALLNLAELSIGYGLNADIMALCKRLMESATLIDLSQIAQIRQVCDAGSLLERELLLQQLNHEYNVLKGEK